MSTLAWAAIAITASVVIAALAAWTLGRKRPRLHRRNAADWHTLADRTGPPVPRGSRVALVFQQLGGPDTLADVEPFLYNLFVDPDIIPVPAPDLFQRPLARFISRRRAPGSRELYRQIGGGSPLLGHTRAQAKAITERVSGAGWDCHPYIAMRYWHPFTEEVLAALQNDGFTRVVLVPLYPHWSIATSGSSVGRFADAVQESGAKVEWSVVGPWPRDEAYISALTRRIHEALEKIPEQTRDGAQVIFSAHGLPQRIIDAGDPYLDHVQQTAKAAAAEAGLAATRWHLSFQSKVGPVKWLEPSTEALIERLAHEGHRALVIVAVSFVSDHVETLQEIDIQYGVLAKAKGVEHFVRAESFNGAADFADVVAARVVEHLTVSK